MTVCVGTAAAQSLDAARALLAEARVHHNEGDHAGARMRYRMAWELSRRASARVLEALEVVHFGDAIDGYEMLADAARAQGDEWVETHRAEIEQTLARLAAGLALVEIRSAPVEATLEIDGEDRTRSLLSHRVAVLPGVHSIVLRIGGTRIAARRDEWLPGDDVVLDTAQAAPMDAWIAVDEPESRRVVPVGSAGPPRTGVRDVAGIVAIVGGVAATGGSSASATGATPMMGGRVGIVWRGAHELVASWTAVPANGGCCIVLSGFRTRVIPGAAVTPVVGFDVGAWIPRAVVPTATAAAGLHWSVSRALGVRLELAGGLVFGDSVLATGRAQIEMWAEFGR